MTSTDSALLIPMEQLARVLSNRTLSKHLSLCKFSIEDKIINIPQKFVSFRFLPTPGQYIAEIRFNKSPKIIKYKRTSKVGETTFRGRYMKIMPNSIHGFGNSILPPYFIFTNIKVVSADKFAVF